MSEKTDATRTLELKYDDNGKPSWRSCPSHKNIKVRGGFRMVPLVCFLWNLVWCREIRKTYHDIREFQL